MRINQSIRRLPSGSYTTQVQINGRRKSITAKTKKELERRVLEYSLTLSDAPSQPLGALVDKYISSKENVLSPSTIASYKKIRREHFQDMMAIPADQITSDMLQVEINQLALDHAPKTVRNIYGLISSTLHTYAPNMPIRVTLPKKRRITYSIPNTDEVFRLIMAAGEPLRTAIMLAAFCGLRRSEIIALRPEDIKDNVIHVSRAAVYDDMGGTVIKQPKTYQSDRYVTIPDIVADFIHLDDEKGVDLGLSTLTRQFVSLRKKLGLSCRFHDLRHYYASFQHAIGIPDVYIMQSGGWRSDTILKQVYRNALDDERRRNDDKINDFLKRSANEVQTKFWQTMWIALSFAGSSPAAPIESDEDR